MATRDSQSETTEKAKCGKNKKKFTAIGVLGLMILVLYVIFKVILKEEQVNVEQSGQNGQESGTSSTSTLSTTPTSNMSENENEIQKNKTFSEKTTTKSPKILENDKIEKIEKFLIVTPEIEEKTLEDNLAVPDVELIVTTPFSTTTVVTEMMSTGANTEKTESSTVVSESSTMTTLTTDWS